MWLGLPQMGMSEWRNGYVLDWYVFRSTKEVYSLDDMVKKNGRVSFKKLEKSNIIPDDKEVRLTETKGLYKIKSIGRESTTLLKFRKLDKDTYENIETKERFKYRKSEHRGNNIESIKKSFKKLNLLIEANFSGVPNELFITLTYREEMKETAKLYKDFDKYMKRVKYKYGKVEYINVAEPQGNESWHCHVLMKFSDYESIFIDNDTMADIWGHGYTQTKGLDTTDGFKGYFSVKVDDDPGV